MSVLPKRTVLKDGYFEVMVAAVSVASPSYRPLQPSVSRTWRRASSTPENPDSSQDVRCWNYNCSTYLVVSEKRWFAAW